MNKARMALFLTAILSSACGFGSYPDNDGSYRKQFPTTPLSNQVCQVDEDCVLTARRDGSCCDATCGKKYVFNNDTFERLQAHQADICAEGKFDCPMAECVPASTTKAAKCVEGHCQIVETPKLAKAAKAAKIKKGKLGKGGKAKSKAPKQKGGKSKAGKRKAQRRP